MSVLDKFRKGGKVVSEGVKEILHDKAFWGGGALTAATYGAGVGAGQVGKLLEGRRKVRAYQDMLEANPMLTKKNPAKTQAYFNSMYRVSPGLAQDPYVAGAWVHNVLDNEDPHDPRPNYTLLAAVQDLAGAGKNYVDIRKNTIATSPATQAVDVFRDTSSEAFKSRLRGKNEFERGKQEGIARVMEANAKKYKPK